MNKKSPYRPYITIRHIIGARLPSKSRDRKASISYVAAMLVSTSAPETNCLIENYVK